MLNDLIRQQALEWLVGAIRHPDPKVRNLLAELFWDLQYIYRFGIPKIPPAELQIPWPPQPQPDPSPLDRLRLHENILMGLVDIYAYEPDPETNLSYVLRDRTIRLTAAKGLSQRLNTALQQLDKEIAQLEQKF
ncbi:MAG TPA: hypothetical protein DD379_18370 [Cyanobacteria bacterium UBA11162]|nr:hypothetical protein [Cyanobacteria bacterium UBA11162]